MGVTGRLGAEVIQGPAEELARALGLGEGAKGAIIGSGQDNVVEVSRLMPRPPERDVNLPEIRTSLPLPFQRPFDRRPG